MIPPGRQCVPTCTVFAAAIIGDDRNRPFQELGWQGPDLDDTLSFQERFRSAQCRKTLEPVSDTTTQRKHQWLAWACPGLSQAYVDGHRRHIGAQGIPAAYRLMPGPWLSPQPWVSRVSVCAGSAPGPHLASWVLRGHVGSRGRLFSVSGPRMEDICFACRGIRPTRFSDIRNMRFRCRHSFFSRGRHAFGQTYKTYVLHSGPCKTYETYVLHSGPCKTYETYVLDVGPHGLARENGIWREAGLWLRGRPRAPQGAAQKM